MKQIYSIFMWVTCLACLVACEKDSTVNPYATDATTISIAKSDVLFGPEASTGTIEIQSSTDITDVKTSANWLTTSVNGKVVTVYAQANDRVEGRSARVTINTQQGSTYVVVQQHGQDFILSANSEIAMDEFGKEFSFFTKSNIPCSFESTVDWITFVQKGNQLIVTVEPNSQFVDREGTIKYEAGSNSGVITFKQAAKIKPIEKAIGNYKLVYQSSSQWVYTPVALEEDGEGGYQLRFTGESYAALGIILPVTITEDPETFDITMTIANCTEMKGTYTTGGVDYSLMGMLAYVKGTSIYRSSAAYNIIGTYNKNDDDTMTWDFEFDAAGKAKGTFYGIRISYTTDGYSGHKAWLSTFISPYLLQE